MRRLDVPMAENIIAAMIYLPIGGTIIRMLGSDLQLMPDDYRLIAERLMVYWREFSKPPGVHAIDLFADIIGRQDDPRLSATMHILNGAHAIKDGINGDFVLSRLATYMRSNTIKSGILEIAETIGKNEEEATLAEVEGMLAKLLRDRRVNFDPGLGINDIPTFLDSLEYKRGFLMNIPPLDETGVVPQPKTLTVLVGVTGRGKTWYLVHCGACAIEQRKKVVHVSLEIDAPDVLGRYYQRLFTASEHAVQHLVTELHTDDAGRLTSHNATWVDPKFSFRDASRDVDPQLATNIAGQFKRLGWRANNLWIRAWPQHKVTIDTLEAYLDTLADVHHFEPDVLLVDYPKLFKFKDPESLRLELGYAVEDLRRIAQERNLAAIMVHQSNRAGAQAKQVGLTHISEDWSIVGTADTVLSYSATESEQRFNLGRLHIDKARAARGTAGGTIILSQNYDLGQFVRTAVLMPSNYMTYLDRDQPEAHAAPEDEERIVNYERTT